MTDLTTPLLPGATIGILGSGQLGRMLALVARRMGYGVHVYSPEAHSPTGQVADVEMVAAYDDLAALQKFAEGVDVVTYEFENVPAITAVTLAERVPLRPGPHVLTVCQNRLQEKNFLAAHGLPVAPFVPVHSLMELEVGLAQIGCPAVLKTAVSGYDGKGQVKITAPEQAAEAWQMIGQTAVLEAFVPFQRELSVVAVRGLDHTFAYYGPIENSHTNHILDIAKAPADVPTATTQQAVALAQAVLQALDVVGVLCVEFFMLADGRLLINELAPRPHNSGHLTIEANPTSQFEQQLRAVCGLPLGATTPAQPAAMANLLGDLWQNGTPNWTAVYALPQIYIHLYGKHSARPGRKMGHLTVLAENTTQAEALARKARSLLEGDTQ